MINPEPIPIPICVGVIAVLQGHRDVLQGPMLLAQYVSESPSYGVHVGIFRPVTDLAVIVDFKGLNNSRRRSHVVTAEAGPIS